MTISILTRKTRLKDRAAWETALNGVLPRIRELLDKQPGFESLQYLWSAENNGEFAQITAWKNLEECQQYVRAGAAAAIATIEDAAVPTAGHPDGAWLRRTYEVVVASEKS